MFWNLFKKEFKYIFRNITFYIFIVVVGFFYFSEFSQSTKIENLKPSTPEELRAQKKPIWYGSKEVVDPKKEIREIYMNLYRDYQSGQILKDKIILNVNVNLSEEEKQYIKEAMDKIAPEEYLEKNDEKLIKVSYEEYLNIVRDLDKKLGGATFYADKNREGIVNEPKTYEDAVKDYKDLLEKDKVTNAAGRLFSDYLGITAGVFPVFLSAFILMKDKRNKMQELICSRSISSYTYVLSKYAALCTALMIPFLVFASYATFTFYKIAKVNNYTIDMLAFFKYTFYWIGPTILFTTALGMLISIVFNNGIIAIPIQFILWHSSLLPLSGDYSLSKFVIRFNTLGEYSNYIKWSSSIALNRIFYVIVSIILALITAYIWSKKRGVVGERIK